MRKTEPSLSTIKSSAIRGLSLLPAIVLIAAASGCRAAPTAVVPPYALGADISWVPEQEAQGIRFSDNGVEKDIFQILKDHGINFIRLRIFNDPKAWGGYSSQGFCDLAHTMAMALRIKAAGMRFLLDFHYSDTWADPAHQNKPDAWKDLAFPDLVRAIHDYTRDVLTALKNQNTLPDIVQTGNEIGGGMLWPDGDYNHLDNLAALLRSAVSAVREVSPSIKIMEHVAFGGDNEKSRWWFDAMIARGVDFDIIGESYYPEWHGTPADLRNNLTDLAGRYAQSIIVAEYSQFKREVNDIVRGLPNGKGLGAFIWEPTKWSETVFDLTGGTNDLIHLYDRMAADYGLH